MLSNFKKWVCLLKASTLPTEAGSYPLAVALEKLWDKMESFWNRAVKLTKIMASGPITSWEIDGQTVETVSDFMFLGSKITADGDCSHEIKRRLLLGRKVMTNLDSVFKSRDITLPTKVHLVKAMGFPVFVYGCESWTVKKAERQRIDALNCGVGDDSWESLGLQGDPTSPFWRRSALGFLWKEWY